VLDNAGANDPSPPPRTITVEGSVDLELYFTKPASGLDPSLGAK
jgi:hypothetical protein